MASVKDQQLVRARVQCDPCGAALLELDQIRMSRQGAVGWVYRCPVCRVVALASQSTKWVPGMESPLPVTHLVYGGVPRRGEDLALGDTIRLDERDIRERGVVTDLLAVCQLLTIVVHYNDRQTPRQPARDV